MDFRTRFAPSPTGYLHVGGARTALYCWLQARKEQGQFILRIEDTDRERSTDEAVDAILESLKWLGLDADEGPIFQTDRFDRYAEIIGQLLQQGDAYHCYCSREELDDMREAQRQAKQKPKYDGRCRGRSQIPVDVTPVVRFKSPETGSTGFCDLVRGELSFENAELDDLVIQRSDGTPTYNLTVVVDDMDMNINHVIRGDDHINNTPRQINIFNALKAQPPKYAHVPMILGADGARLSKRHGAVSVLEYRNDGFLPEALLNYLVRLGWSCKDQEIFSIEELIEKFEISDVNRAASAFNQEKLLWLNQQYIMKADQQRLCELLKNQLQTIGVDSSQGPQLKEVVEAYRERAQTIVELAKNVSGYYRDFDQYDEKAAKKHLRPVIFTAMTHLRERLAGIEQWNAAVLSEVILEVAADEGLTMPKLAQPLRVALTGSASSPSIDTTLALTGKKRALERIDTALSFIQARMDTAGAR